MKQTTFFRFIFGTALITVSLFFFLPTKIAAQNSGTTGPLTWDVSPTTGNNRTLTISGTGAMPHDFYYTWPWAHLVQYITTINIGSGVTSIGVEAFRGCKITSVSIPNGITCIGLGSFAYCSSLQTVNYNAINCITDGFEWIPVFQGCTAFTTLNIGANVTTIPADFFVECSSITGTLTIPNSVTSIGMAAFWGCNNITAIISYPTTPPTINMHAFSVTSIPVYVPCASLTAYQSATGWNHFTNYQTIDGSYAPSQPNVISGSPTACIGGGAQMYSISSVSDATSYTWNLPSGWSGSSTSTSISATPEANAQSGNISVTANNHCGSSPARTLEVTVNAIPAQPEAISGSTTVCAGSGTQIYSISAVSGAINYSWSLPSGWNGTSNNTIISATPGFYAVSGNISVTANNNCGYSAASTLNVTVKSIPVQPETISGPTTVYAGSTAQTYSIAAVSDAISYTWNLPSGWSGNSTGTSISATPGANAQSGNIIVTANNDCGSSIERTLSVTVNPVGIQENIANQIQIYPNPTTGELRIESGELRIENVEIFDVYGKKISSHRLPSSSNSFPPPLILIPPPAGEISHHHINISDLSAGVYFVKIYTEKGEVVRKVVKE